MLRTLLRPFRRHVDQLRTLEQAAPKGPACLDDLAIARLADGAGTSDELSHLSRCPACRAEVAELRRLLGSGAVARELDRLEPTSRPGGWSHGGWPVVAAAAAVVALVLVWRAPFRSTAESDRLRDHPAAAPEIVPVLLAPHDTVTGQLTFRWSAVQSASEYRLTVFDAEGGLVWSDETNDTTATPAATASFAPDTEYWWRVEARVDFDRWVASDLADFELR